MVEPLQAALAKQMRQTVAARLEFGIAHGFAGVGHDESGLKRTQMSMLAGIHRVSKVLMRPEQESRALAPGHRSCADCAEPMALPSPAPRSPRNAPDRFFRRAGFAAFRCRG